jgi:hypothetical protein
MTTETAIAMAHAAVAALPTTHRVQKGMSRQARGRIGGLTTAARYTPQEMTERLQLGKARYYLAQVDREAEERGQGPLSDEERGRRAALLLKAHLTRIASMGGSTTQRRHGRNPRMPGESR